MSIHDFVEKIKGGAGERVGLLPTLLVLGTVSIVSFSLGYAARAPGAEASSSVVIQCDNKYVNGLSANTDRGVIAGGLTSNAPDTGRSGSFTASKNGSKYYPAGCAGADRIQEENRVYFDTEQQAMVAGYGLASTCK